MEPTPLCWMTLQMPALEIIPVLQEIAWELTSKSYWVQIESIFDHSAGSLNLHRNVNIYIWIGKVLTNLSNLSSYPKLLQLHRSFYYDANHCNGQYKIIFQYFLLILGNTLRFMVALHLLYSTPRRWSRARPPMSCPGRWRALSLSRSTGCSTGGLTWWVERAIKQRNYLLSFDDTSMTKFGQATVLRSKGVKFVVCSILVTIHQ